jgi:hypothetical protein
MESYYYLPPVPAGNIHLESLNTAATIDLPNLDTSTGGFYYFKNFTIFYRIYVSGEPNAVVNQFSSEVLNVINPTLWQDYNAIYPSTDITSTTVNTSIGSLFRNRKYYELALEDAEIRNVLSASSLGNTIVIDFPTVTGSIPTMTINGTVHNLYRSNGENAFRPLPDRYFLNSPDLNSSGNITIDSNLDVADRSGTLVSRYTYISLYIVIAGMDDNYTPIYSNPTFIGILRLAESS